MELCVETLGEVVSLLARDDVGPVEADRGELAKALLPTVLRIAATMMKDRNREEGIPSDDQSQDTPPLFYFSTITNFQFLVYIKIKFNLH